MLDLQGFPMLMAMKLLWLTAQLQQMHLLWDSSLTFTSTGIVVSELKKLFQRMVTARTPSVTYEKSLARLTLVNVVDDGVDERVRRRSTVTGDKAPIVENQQSMATSTNETSEEYDNNSTAVLTDSPTGHTPAEIADDYMSDALTVVEEDLSQFNEERLADVEHAKDAQNGGELDPRTLTVNDPDRMNIDESLQNSSCGGASIARIAPYDMLRTSPTPSQENKFSGVKPPPVPPRSQTKDQEPHFEEFARQQDVREVIQNVLHQFRWAIKPAGLEESGESIDIISRLVLC